MRTDTNGWKASQPVGTPDGAVRQNATPPEVTFRACAVVKEILREQFPQEQFEELIWGYSVSNVDTANPCAERAFNFPESAPSLRFTIYWWNEVFQLIREEVLRGQPAGFYLTKCAEVYKIPPPRTYRELFGELSKLDSAVWCDPSQRHIYFRDNIPIEEMVVPYLLRDWLIEPLN